jgi:hypothetical protein
VFGNTTDGAWSNYSYVWHLLVTSGWNLKPTGQLTTRVNFMTLIAFYNDVNSEKFWCETSGYLWAKQKFSECLDTET